MLAAHSTIWLKLFLDPFWLLHSTRLRWTLKSSWFLDSAGLTMAFHDCFSSSDTDDIILDRFRVYVQATNSKVYQILLCCMNVIVLPRTLCTRHILLKGSKTFCFRTLTCQVWACITTPNGLFQSYWTPRLWVSTTPCSPSCSASNAPSGVCRGSRPNSCQRQPTTAGNSSRNWNATTKCSSSRLLG